VLQAALGEVVCAEPAALTILERFKAVLVQDSSMIVLPDELQEVWSGCGGWGAGAKSALKLQVRLDLKGGTLEGPILAQGRWHDQKAAAGLSELPKGALRLADLGYFNLRGFAEMTQQGVYFLSRLKAGTKLFAEAGQELDLPDALAKLDAPLDIPVELGAGQRLKVRLLGVKVPPEVSVQRRRRLKEKGRKKMRQPSKQQLNLCEWNLLITNAPASLVSVEEALVLARARWQID
jgi:hypothetical protein